MEGPSMTFVFHHGGLFKKNVEGDMVYEPDNTEVLMGVEGDTLDVFFVRGYYRELGYIEAGNLDNMEDEVVNVEAESLKQRKSLEAKKCSSQPVKKSTTMVPESKKQTSHPNRTILQPKSQPSKPTIKPISEPNQPKMKPNSQSNKPVHQPKKTISQPKKTTSQPMKHVPQAKKTIYQAKSVPPQSTASSEAANNSQGNKDKQSSSGCRVTRSGRQVKKAPLHEDDTDSHDSYESTEDELYRPPKIVGDNLYSSNSDSDSENSDKVLESDEESPAVYPQFNEKTKFGLLKFEEKTPHPAPVPPPFKANLGRPTKKRRRDKEEQPTGSKTKMKRKYNPIRCMYCSEIRHNKRSCAKKKAMEAKEHARQLQLQLAVVAPAADGADPQVSSVPAEHNPAPADIAPSPTQPPTEQVTARPPKLKIIKRKARLQSSPKPTIAAPVAISAETIKGTSSATVKKLANFMTFVPTPGFKPPRKTDK
ncbi:hypothetical protein Ahy_B08g089427 [Arachis hypogaea]|uniref:PB1-like domain-containing protein n=1 Tax=Arachis hypogaea TaxID=3818 RepID=A0A444XXX0_ARAHY|nr:hypothetical protein Ahy_B08g089427 [Arachis hypogaea]